MSFIKLQFKPGVNRDQTSYSGEGGWYSCNLIRFRSGYPQKMGGWSKATSEAFSGVCRQMWNWVTTYQDNLVAIGTSDLVYIDNGGFLSNITPIRDTFTTPDTDNCLSATNASTTLVASIAVPHGLTDGDYVRFSGVVGPIQGIPATDINKTHRITVIGADSFSFEVATPASGTSGAGEGGTAIVLSAYISPSYAISVNGYGWGTGTWGRNAWGLGSTSPVYLPQRDWWFDNFDNDLVLNIRNGAPYWWERGTTSDPSTALATSAITLQDYATAEGFDPNAVPVKVMQLLVSQQDKHLLAFGAVPFGSTSEADFDPLLIRWADQDTPADWTPSVTNSAGDLRVSRGSKIVRAMPSRQETLVWTDTALYTLQFLGTTDVFSLQEYSDNISVMSPRAMANAANITYWMGQDKFYAYTGRVETLPCTLRDHVFNNINLAQADQVICGTNEQWNEVWWFYPTADSDTNNAYVVYNHLERIWYYGYLDRTSWLDTSLRHYPIATNSVITVNGSDVTVGPGTIYYHESGIDADGAAMDSYIESSDFDLGDGDNFMLTRRVIPDIDLAGSTATDATVTFQIKYRNFPGNSLTAESEDRQPVVEATVGTYTQQVFIRARARQMSIKVASDSVGVQWQLGAPRLDARPDGRR